MEPVSNYLLAMGGNPRFLSATTHLGNMVAHSTDRPVYTYQGQPVKNTTTNIIEKHVVGSPRLGFPIREDFRLIIREVHEALQVNKRANQPYKKVRYPQTSAKFGEVQPGEFKAEQLQARINWLMDALHHSNKEARDLATLEFENFFQPEELDHQDPLGSLSQVSIYENSFL